jgi:hypothetical protein
MPLVIMTGPQFGNSPGAGFRTFNSDALECLASGLDVVASEVMPARGDVLPTQSKERLAETPRSRRSQRSTINGPTPLRSALGGR